MMKIISKIIFSISIFFCLANILHAQNVSDLIISEISANNENGIFDDYGRRSGWIEIMNTSHGTVDFSGCYLSDDRNNLTKSEIPETDNRTTVGPRQVALFFASGNKQDGTFYIDFTLKNGKTIYLISNDGRTIIDSLTIPKNLPIDKSVCKFAFDDKQMDFNMSEEPQNPTPMKVNGSSNIESKSDKMAREDPHGWILTLVSVSVVFLALAILWFIFGLMGDKFKQAGTPTKNAKTGTQGTQPTKAGTPGTQGTPGGNATQAPDAETAAAIMLALKAQKDEEICAAITMALNMYSSEQVHDNESYVITLRKTAGSSWSAKSNNFRKTVNKK